MNARFKRAAAKAKAEGKAGKAFGKPAGDNLTIGERAAAAVAAKKAEAAAKAAAAAAAKKAKPRKLAKLPAGDVVLPPSGVRGAIEEALLAAEREEAEQPSAEVRRWPGLLLLLLLAVVLLLLHCYWCCAAADNHPGPGRTTRRRRGSGGGGGWRTPGAAWAASSCTRRDWATRGLRPCRTGWRRLRARRSRRCHSTATRSGTRAAKRWRRRWRPTPR